MDRDRAGQPGDIEGLSPIAEAGPESVESLLPRIRRSRPRPLRVLKTQQTIPKGRYIRTTSTDGRMTLHQRKGPNNNYWLLLLPTIFAVAAGWWDHHRQSGYGWHCHWRCVRTRYKYHHLSDVRPAATEGFAMIA